ncbi:MAG: hypothetical protein KIS81_00730 [Maricaulaceae bacterium]|nr:hypothetical protein [Maricaulaceae bacterium]
MTPADLFTWREARAAQEHAAAAQDGWLRAIARAVAAPRGTKRQREASLKDACTAALKAECDAEALERGGEAR